MRRPHNTTKLSGTALFGDSNQAALSLRDKFLFGCVGLLRCACVVLSEVLEADGVSRRNAMLWAPSWVHLVSLLAAVIMADNSRQFSHPFVEKHFLQVSRHVDAGVPLDVEQVHGPFQ